MLPLEAHNNDPSASKPGEGADEVARQTRAERRLVRKVDLLLMPVLLCSAGLQYYDSASTVSPCPGRAQLTPPFLLLLLLLLLALPFDCSRSRRSSPRLGRHLWHHQGPRPVDHARQPRDGQGRRLDPAVLDRLVRFLCVLLLIPSTTS